LGQANGLPVPDTVGPDGVYLPGVPLFAGHAVYRPDGKPGDADKAVTEAVEKAGGLMARGSLVHSYPHSWRSKAPLIFRNTPQWFISMETNGLRQKALKAIADARWVPAQGRNRIEAMGESKPEWCVSRHGACGTRGRAPYQAVLTHGFLLDEEGRKMSKSLGNVMAPQEIMQQSGADVLRLWVVGSDYTEDVRFGPEILKHHSDVYRRLRNTL